MKCRRHGSGRLEVDGVFVNRQFIIDSSTSFVVVEFCIVIIIDIVPD
jgi:hypothetical protein